MSTSRGRVVVAMSGGVDSSVAALLLARQGYEVIGVTLRLYSEERAEAAPLSRGCCTLEDIDDARRVCAAIGARHYVVNAEREFRARRSSTTSSPSTRAGGRRTRASRATT